MTNNSDPLSVLLSLRTELKLEIDDSLIETCYEIQRNHQYDKDRNTLKKMQAVIEESITKHRKDVLL